MVLVFDDRENLAVVSRANDDLATEGDVLKGRMDVGHEVAEGHVEAFEVRAVEHGDLVDEEEVGTQEEFANRLAEGNGTRGGPTIDVGVLRGLAPGVEGRAPVHQQSGYTGGGHGESNMAL